MSGVLLPNQDMWYAALIDQLLPDDFPGDEFGSAVPAWEEYRAPQTMAPPSDSKAV